MSVPWKHYNHMLPLFVMRSITESGAFLAWLAAILAIAVVLYRGT